jgi:hypothetical protein
MCATFFYGNILDKPSQTMGLKWQKYHGKIMVLWLGSRENHGKPRGSTVTFSKTNPLKRRETLPVEERADL